jgi:hypothetical protein
MSAIVSLNTSCSLNPRRNSRFPLNSAVYIALFPSLPYIILFIYYISHPNVKFDRPPKFTNRLTWGLVHPNLTAELFLLRLLLLSILPLLLRWEVVNHVVVRTLERRLLLLLLLVRSLSRSLHFLWSGRLWWWCRSFILLEMVIISENHVAISTWLLCNLKYLFEIYFDRCSFSSIGTHVAFISSTLCIAPIRLWW